MANYTPIFEKPYPNGYEDLPSETTPVTADTLNDKDNAIVNIESYLEANPIGGGGGASTEIIANDYDAEKTYNEGEYCAYNNTIWKSLSVNIGETPEEGEYWTEVVVMDEVEIAMNSGGSANIWEGSHAEYEEEKAQIPDETTLLFNDDIGLEAESDYYSEVEQVIGTYLGKPLYRKVFNLPEGLTLTPNTWISIGVSSSSFDSFVNSKAINATDGTKFDVFCSKVNNYVNILSTRSTNVTLNANSKVILEYTKTTDSVVGVVGGIKKGDNYSTNEQVIGTWIDGKPLYRSYFNYGALPSGDFGSFVYKNHGIANIDKITNLRGIVTFANGSKSLLPYVTTTLSAIIGVLADATQFGIMVGQDRSTASAIAFIEYTKTTD